MTRVVLPDGLRAQILREARGAHPRECCGLIEGVCEVEGAGEAQTFRITALHPARNLADAPDRFDIDPGDQFAAYKAARARWSAIVGCYHSHPNGRAEPSAADQAGAVEENFLWLIASRESVSAFIYSRGQFLGADWVTSSA
jgi:proteasome lid subunit RPN8/RPN11